MVGENIKKVFVCVKKARQENENESTTKNSQSVSSD